jgi:hypothetical protein
LLAYLNELQPVSLGPGGENDLAYQDADGDMSLDPLAPEMMGEVPPPGAGDPNILGLEEEMPPPALSEDVALEGEEGFPALGTTNPEIGMDSRMMAMAQHLLGGARGPRME